MPPVRVLIVHDEEEARHAARTVVSGTSALEVVGEAATAEEALELGVALRPGLVLIGTGMPGIDGPEAGRRLKAVLPETAVVLVYKGAEPGPDALAEADAAAAVRLDELTTGFLRPFGEELQSG